MSKIERTYDVLDVIRVVKGVWRWALFVPVLAAGVVGAWAYFSAPTVSLPFRSETVIRFPAAAFEVDAIERLTRSIVPEPAAGRANFALSADEVPAQFSPSYRALKLTVDAASDGGGQALLEAAIERFGQEVQAFDTQHQLETQEIAAQRDLLSGYLVALGDQNSLGPDDTIAESNAAASLVSALAILDTQMRQSGEKGKGPLVVVSPIETQSVTAGLRWLRFPIVAAIGGFLAVLFIAFTKDGIRIAATRRRSRV